MSSERQAFGTRTRPSTVAGHFYLADPDQLRAMVRRLLAEAPAPVLAGRPLALMAPHAGYDYSGRIAAAAYRAVRDCAVDRVLILAPSHRVDFDGVAMPSSAAFATPLGDLPVDQDVLRDLARNPLFVIEDAAHAAEHAIEVQLPFLQESLTATFQIVPLAFRRLPREGLAALAEPLAELIAERRRLGQNWLIVASTDTYHGYDPQDCLANDERLMELLPTMDVKRILSGLVEGRLAACGGLPLVLAIALAARFGAGRGTVLDRADSRGPTSQPGDYVVGYLAAAFA